MARICEVISTPWPPEEGISVYVHHLSQELTRRGHDVTVVTRGGFRRQPPRGGNGMAVVPTRYLPAYPFHVDLHAFLMRGSLNGRRETDLVHCHSPLTLPPKESGPVVSTFHSSMALSLPRLEVVDGRSLASHLMRPFSVRIERKLLRRSRSVTAVSGRTSQALSEEYGMSPESVSVLGNGVDPEAFRPSQRTSAPKTILYVGRLAYGKGLFDLVQAAKLLIQSEPEWSFTLVGRGPLASRIERLRDAARIPASKFVLKGFVPHDRMPGEYRQAGLFVLPSHHEGVPTAVLEAMASGLPVVATHVGGIAEVLSDRKTGLLCPPGEPLELANRLREAIQDGALRARLAEAGRLLALRRFTWGQVVERWTDSVREQLPGVLT